MAAVCVSRSDRTMIKPPNDKRLYRFIELRNGLKTLIVHDPEIVPECAVAVSSSLHESTEDEGASVDDTVVTDSSESDDGQDYCACNGNGGTKGELPCPMKTKKAAAAMCVAMGSFCDPIEAQGLAHFLEHMLFMGSEAFPDENEYDSYLSMHGGASNAYTDVEHTCYYFEVNSEFLKGALLRFSQFFVSPLVKRDAMEREVLAVDSEFKQVMQNDDCRLQQLQCHTSGVGQLFNRFFWGNKKSLVDAIEKGIDLRDQILKLYGDFYHGGMMNLVVIGGESVDMLESWVAEMFLNIKMNTHNRPVFKLKQPTCGDGELYRLEAVKDIHRLVLTWILPCLRPHYLKKPDDYLAHLIGHEGKGSLYYFLKDSGWVISLSAGVGDGVDRSSVAYIFEINIHLTVSGREKIYDIIGFVFQYLKLLRLISPRDWIFKELQDIGNMEFLFQEQQQQQDYAVELAENLLIYPVEHVIYGDYAYELWDEQLIQHILEFLTPERMKAYVITKIATSEAFQMEPWFESRYIKELIPPNVFSLWQDPPEVHSSLHLPEKNIFIPHDFSILADHLKNLNPFSSFPVCVVEESLMRLWYKADTTFRLPRVNAYFRVHLKGGYDDLISSVLCELFVLLLEDELNEIIYLANIAKLQTSFSYASGKLDFKIYGFSDKIQVLISEVVTVMKSFVPTESRFKVVKEEFERSLRNTNMNPLKHSKYMRIQVLCKRFYDVEDTLYVLSDISFTKMKDFIPQLRSEVFIEGICNGNLSESKAISISNIFKQSFCQKPLHCSQQHKEHVNCFPPGAILIRDATAKNKSETNSVIELYFQFEPELGLESIKLKALIDLFDMIVEEKFFNQLRTKEQLGYIVQCGPRVTFRVFGFCFSIQSSDYDPVHLHGRIDSFICSLEKQLEEMEEEKFMSHKSGLISKLLVKDTSLLEETDRFWNQIIDKRYIFDYPVKEADEARCLEKQDIIRFYRSYMLQSSPKCRRLAVRVWGCNTNIERAEALPPLGRRICDIDSFKLSSSYYPSFC